jgi:hypothetical protein
MRLLIKLKCFILVASVYQEMSAKYRKANFPSAENLGNFWGGLSGDRESTGNIWGCVWVQTPDAEIVGVTISILRLLLEKFGGVIASAKLYEGFLDQWR